MCALLVLLCELVDPERQTGDEHSVTAAGPHQEHDVNQRDAVIPGKGGEDRRRLEHRK